MIKIIAVSAMSCFMSGWSELIVRRALLSRLAASVAVTISFILSATSTASQQDSVTARVFAMCPKRWTLAAEQAPGQIFLAILEF